ncbi:MAG: hypothetical protein JWO67_1435 [Streptosporangiaceae bacterium]|nr:hypothetical protein [Streptosporangiaceae bacterium]
MSRFPIPRPTEDAAIAAASRSVRPLPPMEVLFDRLVMAYAVRDRIGLALFGRQVVRASLGKVGEQ